MYFFRSTHIELFGHFGMRKYISFKIRSHMLGIQYQQRNGNKIADWRLLVFIYSQDKTERKEKFYWHVLSIFEVINMLGALTMKAAS